MGSCSILCVFGLYAHTFSPTCSVPMACSPFAVATSVAGAKLSPHPRSVATCSSVAAPSPSNKCFPRSTPPLTSRSIPRAASPIPVTNSTSDAALVTRSAPAPTLSQKLARLLKMVRTSLTIEEAPVTKSATLATTCTVPVTNPLAPFQSPQKRLQLLCCGAGGETDSPPPPPPPAVINIRPVGSLYVSGLPLT